MPAAQLISKRCPSAESISKGVYDVVWCLQTRVCVCGWCVWCFWCVNVYVCVVLMREVKGKDVEDDKKPEQ